MSNEKIKITYDVLVDIFRKEKNSSDLQKLDETFLEDVLNYLKEKQERYEEMVKEAELLVEDDLKKFERQLTNIKKIIISIYEKREEKIMKMALNKSKAKSIIIDTSNMLDHELKMFNTLVSILTSFRESVVQNILKLKEPKIPQEFAISKENEDKNKKMKVLFLQPVPKFVDVSGETYGPFDKDEIAILPLRIVEILEKKKKVKIIK